MGKMYYSEEETAQKLGVSAQQLRGLVEQAKLRVYTDAGRRMYKAEEVDALAPAQAAETGEVELTPAESTVGDQVALSEADKAAAAPGKEDTVITSEGISIFDSRIWRSRWATPWPRRLSPPAWKSRCRWRASAAARGCWT